jgi:ELWxxDGT repeat protein/VCBS repeat-containing protein
MSLAQLFYLKESIRHRVRRRFPRKPVHRSSGFTMESLENRLLLSMTPVAPDLSNVMMDATNLEPNPITQAVSPNQTASFQLDYQDTGSGTGTSGLGLRIHYNSSQLIPGEAGLDGQWGTADDVEVLTNIFAGSATTVITGPQDQADTNNDDGDASTDRFLLIEWTDNSGQFPIGPAELLIANWTTTANFTGTTVNFTASALPTGDTLSATPAEFTLAQQDVDSDGDGISDPVEAGDNNNDGTPDAQQANVASLLDFSGTNRVTFWTRTDGTFFTNMQAVETPADVPAGVTLPFGAFSYQVNGLTPGNAAHVQVILPNGSTVNNFYKFGPEAGNTTPHWYSFDYDTTTRAGVIFDPAIQLFLRDGQRGDSDLEANGVIVDPIAPAVDPNASGLIVGNVWSDVNKNGVFDRTESGANGWTVFIDQNLNGVLDQGEPTSVTADFDVDSDGQIVPWQERGVFAFDNLAAGTYRIGLVQDQPGWTLTSPSQPFIDVTLTAGVISKNNLFGVNQNVAPTAVDDAYTMSQDTTLTIGFNLLKDIVAGSGGASPNFLTSVNGTLFFMAYDDIHGVELWTSDGTEAGTVLVKDIAAGSGSSYPINLTNVNGTLFFMADDGINGPELWKSDGTEMGTLLVKDIWAGSGGSYPSYLTNVNGTLFFAADDGMHGTELWKSGGVLNNDSDPDSLALTAQLVTGPSHGTLTLNPDGTFMYTPTTGFAGADTFTYQASDGTNLSNIATVTITVEGAPVLDAIGNQTVDEGSLLTFTATASDIDAGQTLTFSLANGASGLVPTGARIDPDAGLFTWTPTEAQGPGLYTFDVVVTDNGSPALSDHETIQITVNEVNVVAPTAVDDVYAVSQDSTLNTAFTFNLVKDINLIGDGSYPNLFTDVNGTLFFTVSDINGQELWKSDGTEVGTVLVKDIWVGGSSNPSNLTNVDGMLFFTADDGIHGTELWKSDGTEAGTVLVKDIWTSGGNINIPSPHFLTDVNGTLFFMADDGITGYELWKSDGTEAGTLLVKDIRAGSVGAGASSLTNVNGTLFFTADDGINGRELWRSDGTEAGTVLVKDILVGSGESNHYYLTNVNGTLFFVANDGINGPELWKSDGTEAGTVLVAVTMAGSSSTSSPANLTDVNGTLFFTVDDGINGYELWTSDGTEAGTVLVKDILAGSGWSNPWNLTNVNGTLFFTAEDGSTGRELWTSDGTEAGTRLVKDIWVGGSSNPSNLTNVDGTLFFWADDGITGVELWKSDGTEAGTLLVADIMAGSRGAIHPSYSSLANVNGTLFFTADDGTTGYELWKSDGTETGTLLVRDINTGSVGSNPSNLTNVDGILFFRAEDGIAGQELWKSDGTEAGTQLVKDIYAGSGGAILPEYSSLINVNGTLFFTMDDGTTGVELWKSDGTEAGTVLVKDIRAGSWGSYPLFLTNMNGTLFFAAYDDINGYELWTSDGTEAGTVLVKDIYAGGGSAIHPTYSSLTNVNGTLFFTADDGITGQKLWKSDGTEAGTVLVKDIGASGLTNVNGTLFFNAYDDVNGYELWKSDGTEAGTLLVKDIVTGTGSSNPSNLTNVNGTLFFWADDGINGQELWASDGTEAGTRLVKDIYAGSGWSNPSSLTNVNGTLFFAVDDGINGVELWKSDGTAAGTVLVKDIVAGVGGSYPSYLTNVNGTLFFNAYDDVNGYELWTSDGTEAGTLLVKDIVTGTGSSSPSNLTMVNGTLYFAANDGIHGTELWRSEVGVLGNDSDPDSVTLTAQLVNGPSHGTLTLNPDGTFEYTPTTGFAGTDTFTYQASDGTYLSNIATVTITVTAVNDPPVADDDSYSTEEDTPLIVAGPGVLANDTDVDGDTLTAVLVSGPANGVLTLNADGSFTYTPNANFNGTDSFTYHANDGSADSPVATVSLTITAVNDAPVVDGATFSLDENRADGTVVGTVTATDPDANQTLTFSITSGNINGAFQIDGTTGVISVANGSALDFETMPQFVLTVQALDNGVPVLSGSNSVTINLADVNEAPLLTAPATASVPENTTVVATVTANDPDAGTTLTFSLSGADAARFVLTGTGNTKTLSFIIAPDFENPTDTGGNNVYDVTVAVSDGALSESRSIAVTVTDVNEGTTPYLIQGTNKSDQIIVKEGDNGWLTITVNDKTSRIQLQDGQELQVLGLGGDDHIVLQGLNRNALVDGGNGNDQIIAFDVTNPLSALTLLGGKGNDILVGGRGNDILRGGDGNDILIGWEGDDLLDGGPGNDVLVGGPGQDTLTGGGGKDIILRRGALVTKAWIKEFVGVHD